MSSNQKLNMEKIQPANPKSTETKTATKATTRALTPTPPINRNVSRSPRISPKTQPSPSTQPEISRPSGAFGKYTFGAEVMGWASMGKLNTDPARSRGATVMPEPETDERMKELANGLKVGLKAKAKAKANIEIGSGELDQSARRAELHFSRLLKE